MNTFGIFRIVFQALTRLFGSNAFETNYEPRCRRPRRNTPKGYDNETQPKRPTEKDNS